MNRRHPVVARRRAVSNLLRATRLSWHDCPRLDGKQYFEVRLARSASAQTPELAYKIVERWNPERDQRDDNYEQIACKVEQLLHCVHVFSRVGEDRALSGRLHMKDPSLAIQFAVTAAAR